MESFCPWGKKNNAAVGTLEHHHPVAFTAFFSFFSPLLLLLPIARRSQNATQLCVVDALWELTHANVLFTFLFLRERGVHHEREGLAL